MVKYRHGSGILKLEDFTFIENRVFPPLGNHDALDPTPPHNLAHTFSFKSYAPKVFQKIRDFFEIDVDAYMNSVCGECKMNKFWN